MIKLELKTKIGMKIREHLTCFKAHVPDPDELYSMELKKFIFIIKT